MTQAIKTSGKKFQDLQKKLKKDNAAFARLSPEEQRVTIAKDVLAQLRRGKFRAGHTYFEFGDQGGWNNSVDSDSVDAAGREGIDMSCAIGQVECTVCGIGSLFAASVLKADNLKLKTFLRTNNERNAEVRYLRQWFTKKQLDLVECFFERWSAGARGDYQINLSDETLEESPIFTEMDDTERLRMIMHNIISNSGRFDPFNGKHAVAYQ